MAASQALVPAAVMATAAVRFALTGVAELTGSVAWRHGAGIVGVILAGLAFYAAAALALEAATGRAVLPVLRRRRGRCLTSPAGGPSSSSTPGPRG